MSEVTVSAKDKKKDTRSKNRSCSDKEKEEIEKATRKSLKAERKAAKAKALEEKQLAEVLEQSRLEAERQAKELQALSSKPIVPTPLLVLGKQNLFASDKHGNILGFKPAVPCPFHPNDPFHRERASAAPCTADPNDLGNDPNDLELRKILIEQKEKLRKSIEKRQKLYPARRTTIEENPSSDAPPHSLPPVHLPESDDSKAQEKLGFDESRLLLSSDSKDTVDDNAGLNAGHLPSSECKSDSEIELPFEFPPAEETSTEATSMQSASYSPGPLRSSSSEEATPEVKREPNSGQGSDCVDFDPNSYDPNDPFDIRNGPLYTQGDVYLSSSASDTKTSPIERSVITRKDVDKIRSQASVWQTENDALMAMRHLSSKDSRPNLMIQKEALASVLFQARPPSDTIVELAKAQAESFKVGQKDFERRMAKLSADESKKIRAPRMEVELLKAEYEGKLNALNLRIQASIAIDETSQVSTQQLDDALAEVRKLKDQNHRLQQLLKVVRDGIPLPAESKEKAPNRGNESSHSHVSNSSSSISPFVNSKDVKKRHLSPESQMHNDSSTFKKPNPKPVFSIAWKNWNRDGTLAAHKFGEGPVVRFLQSRSLTELDALLAKVTLAASNFRSLFPTDDQPEIQLRHRNSEPHSKFSDLQAELLIPTISQGRIFALSFYYGQVLTTINGIISSRNAFHGKPDDEAKIAAYIAHRGQQSREVVNYKTADNQNTLMNKDDREFRDHYFRAFELSKNPKLSKPEWMSEVLYNVLHSLSHPCRSRGDIEVHDRLQSEAKVEFIRYYYHINLHTIIDFHRAARAFDNKVRHGKPSGKTSSNCGGPRSSA